MANLDYSPFCVQESDIQALSLSGFKFMERLACDCGLILNSAIIALQK